MVVVLYLVHSKDKVIHSSYCSGDLRLQAEVVLKMYVLEYAHRKNFEKGPGT